MTVEALVSSTQLLDLAGYFADRGEEAHAINLLVAANTLKKWEVAFAQEGATATTHEDVNTLDVQAGAVKGGATVSTHEDNTPPSPRKSPEYVASWFYWEEDGLEQTLVMRIPAGGRRKRAGRGYAQEWVVRAVVEALAQRAERNSISGEAVTFSVGELTKTPGLDTPNAEAQVRVAVRYLQSHGLVDKRRIRRGARPYRLASRSIASACTKLLPSSEEIRTPGLKNLLAAAPLEGIDIERTRDPGPEIAF